MEMKKREVYIKKPIYLGQVILDISKILMYELWYDYLKPNYGENIKLPRARARTQRNVL